MTAIGRFFFSKLGAQAPAIVLIRIAVGLIFGSQGLLKYIDPNMGVNRFTRIGFPHPGFTAHFVGAFEIVCGFLVLIGLFTRLAAVPLLAIISTAFATTKERPRLACPEIQMYCRQFADGRELAVFAVQ